MTFTILGPPRTAKNSMRIVHRGGDTSKPFVISSRTAGSWQKSAVAQLLAAGRRTWADLPASLQGAMGAFPLARPVNLEAKIYRERRTGDLGNFLAAVCDALQRGGIVVDDKWIMGFDGSRLEHDKNRPRVEIRLTPLGWLP